MVDNRKDGWLLYAGDVLIGTAYFRSQDQPWYICDFEPTSQYETYRHIFDAYAKLVNEPSNEQIGTEPADFYEENIESLNLRLVPFGNEWSGEIYVTQIYNGSEIWLRPV
ncbi:MAG: hypothetical protein KF726_05330 [Anaerolineae bacterium]|nr:hypothetical protein [Anaerolineae bacterium]